MWLWEGDQNGDGEAFGFENVNEENRCGLSPPGGELGFQGGEEEGRRFKDDAEGLSQGTEKTGAGTKEEEAEDEKWGKAGWPSELTAQTVKAAHMVSHTIPLQASRGWGGGGHTGEVSLRKPVPRTPFIQTSASLSENPRAAN